MTIYRHTIGTQDSTNRDKSCEVTAKNSVSI